VGGGRGGARRRRGAISGGVALPCVAEVEGGGGPVEPAMVCRRLLGLLAGTLVTPVVSSARWTVLDCPGPPGANLNDTQPGHPAVCSHTNTGATDVVVEMNFQVAGAEKTLGSLSCVVLPGGGTTPVEVCRFSAQSAPYDGSPCWFILPPHAAFRCERVGIFYWLSTQASPLKKSILSKPTEWHPVSCPKPGTGGGSGGCSWSNMGLQDAWLMLSLSNPGHDNEFVRCAVAGVTVCAFHSKFGRVNASSCGFPVGAGQKMVCSASQGARIVSAIAAPLATNILSASSSSAPTAVNLSCPFTTPEANNCPCTHNGSATEDSLIALEFTTPDTSDNSIWCYSSQGEDLCSLSWNGNPGDGAACVFFLAAGEQMQCKIQFGTLLVEQAVAIPLAGTIFAPSSRASLVGGSDWEHLIGNDAGRGPLAAHTDVAAAEVDAAWQHFKQQFGRRFHVSTAAGHAEEQLRKRNFAHSLRQIRALQGPTAARASTSHDDARFGVTEFADWSTAEWLVHTRGLQLPAADDDSRVGSEAEAEEGQQQADDRFAILEGPKGNAVVTGVDWRAKGMTTPVKNQGSCGSCWAFSSTASVESAWAIAGHSLISLSEEFLIDCNYPQSPGGCNGGFNYQAFDFIEKNGIDSEASYKYSAGKGHASNCSRHWPPTSPVRIQGYRKIASNESEMQLWATTMGPFAVGLDAAGPAWKHYIGGVLRSCCNRAQEHAPTVVGWGTEVEGKHAGGKYCESRSSAAAAAAAAAAKPSAQSNSGRARATCLLLTARSAP
jgi:cysteine peptidase B